VLPLDAEGYLGEVANAFLEGFAQSAERYGDVFTLETYRTDGAPASAELAYRQAVADGARFVVGPLLRSSVELVTALEEAETVPTLLLQDTPRPTFAGQLGALPLYTYPLGAEAEVEQFGALAVAEHPRRDIYILAQPGGLGRRLVAMFSRRWTPQPAAYALRVRTVTNAEAWIELHKELRDLLDDTKAADDGGPREKIHPPAVFVAGDAEFASQARASVPTALPVYVLASSAGGLDGSGRSLLGLSGVRYFEMPYVLELQRGGQPQLAADYARGIAAGLQRYLAAGADAYSIVRRSPYWGGARSWSYAGLSGTIVLRDGRFIRSGVPLEIDEGLLTPLDSLAEQAGFIPAAEACGADVADCEL
nr:penicillin-binding protein activator [Betaproteobacteria bacterium AqS2]